MPGPLTYAAITLLARDRIGQIKRALTARKNAGNAGELELHVLHLATEAERMMSASQPVIDPPVRLYGPPLTDHVSRFTLLGAVGPDLPRYAAYFVPGKDWLFHTLHKGTPDENRERVLVHSTELVFDFWRRVGPLIDAEYSKPTKRSEARGKMQAYALGHLCHVATDVLAHPWFESIEARVTDPTAAPPVRRMRRDDVAGAFDAHIADVFFGRGTDTRTKKWADWYPTAGEVPASFAKAMSASIGALYGQRANGLPAFDEAFALIDPQPPALSESLLNEAVEEFRDIIAIERTWTFADWLGATAAMFLPMGFAYFGALVLPRAKDMSVEYTDADGPDAEGERTYESVVYPYAATALAPIVSMIIVSASGRGLRAEGVIGWVQAGLSLVASVGFFASLGGAGGARWSLWFALPMAMTVFQIIFALARGGRENARKLLWLGPLVQLLIGTLFLLLYRGWLHGGVEELQKDSDARDDKRAIGDFAGWMGIVLVLWFVHAVLWRWVFSNHVPDDKDLFAGGEPRQFLQLHDDVGLVHDLAAPFDSDRLGDLSYPPARRALFTLRYEAVGANILTLRVDRDRLTFRWTIPAATPDRVVYAPVAPVTADQFGLLLASVVTGDATLGTLHVTAARADEAQLELSAGFVFADFGDDLVATAEAEGKKAKTVTERDIEATLFKLIGSDEDGALTLYHAPRARLTQQMGVGGTVPETRRATQPSAAGSTMTLVPAAVGAPPSRRYTAGPDGAGNSPLLRALLRRGDVLEIASGVPTGEQRIVEEVLSDTDVVVSSPFLSPIAIGGIGYKRAASDRGVRLAAAATVVVPAPAQGIGPNDLQESGVTRGFGAQFMVGDIVEFRVPLATVLPRRVVVAIRDGATVGAPPVVVNLLELDAPLAPAPTAPFPIERPAAADADGYPFMADANDIFAEGGNVVNDAADLATLLCLGAASRLTSDGTPVTPAGATTPIHRVSQVFRNWNLDRRRLNEWRALVGGGAVSERRGDYRGSEEAAPIDPADAGAVVTDAFVAQRQAAERTVLDRGTLGVFRAWVDMASRQRVDTGSTEVFRPGEANNRDLSRAMAYLIDAAEGVTP
ncbi:MAG: zinc dependent phospholipase C family protein [Gemmatimonadota bacterium]